MSSTATIFTEWTLWVGQKGHCLISNQCSRNKQSVTISLIKRLEKAGLSRIMILTKPKYSRLCSLDKSEEPSKWTTKPDTCKSLWAEQRILLYLPTPSLRTCKKETTSNWSSFKPACLTILNTTWRAWKLPNSMYGSKLLFKDCWVSRSTQLK